jgi:hypothetical protein
MWHATCTQGNRGDSWLLVVRSQIGNLTSGPSFGHNLCFKCPNGSCKPILDIYVPKGFQCYKEIFDSMGFDPCNRSLKIWESIGSPTPKVGIHLGVWGFIPSFSHTPRNMKCDSRTSHLVRTFVSLCLGCEPKTRVVTYTVSCNSCNSCNLFDNIHNI